MEVQETLSQEGLEFMGIRTVKLVWFPDLNMGRGFPGIGDAIGKSAEGLGMIR